MQQRAGKSGKHGYSSMMAEAAAEIARLRARLEIDPRHPYDGIECRNATIKALESEVASLRITSRAITAENRDLWAALDKARAEVATLRVRVADLEEPAGIGLGDRG